MLRAAVSVVIWLLLVVALIVPFAAATAQEKHPPRGPRPGDSCELRDESSRSCLKCRPGYLKKDGGCLQAGDFGSNVPTRPQPNTKPIQPMR